MILQRYFMLEIGKAFGAIIGGLILIYISTRFASYLGQAAEGKIAAHHIGQMIGLKMLVSLKDLIPMSLYLGVFAAVTRLQRDLELVAMGAAGAGTALLMKATLQTTVAAAIVVATITLYAEPRAEQLLQEIRDQTENEATIAGVKAGRFKSLSAGKRVIYAEQVAKDGRTLESAFVQTKRGEDVGLMRASTAYVETDAKSDDRFAVFTDGTSYAGTPGELNYQITRFNKYAIRIENRAPTNLTYNVNYFHTTDLLRLNGPSYAAEFHWRIATPIIALLTPLLALLIAVMSRGSNWYIGMLIAIAAYFLYANLLGVGRALMKRGEMPPFLGLWGFHALLLIAIMILYVLQRNPTKMRRRDAHQLLLKAS